MNLSNLPAGARNSREFLAILYYWHTAGEYALLEWDAPELVHQLEQAGDRPIDALAEWLWGAWQLNPSRIPFIRSRVLISDWWAAHASTMNVAELPPRLGDVAGWAQGWHGMFESEATGRPLADWAKHRVPAVFQLLHAWDDGVTLRRLVLPAVGDRLAVFREIGRVLAHCYLHADVTRHYTADYEMLVLFDAELNPQVTFAVRQRRDERGDLNWQICEQRGIYNIFPHKRWWSYLAELQGGAPQDFEVFPPGVKRLPPNAGTGEPPRARDPRPDGADPVALEYWAAGHPRRAMMGAVQARLYKYIS